MKTNLTFQGEFLAIRNISEKVYLKKVYLSKRYISKKSMFVKKVYLSKRYICKKCIFVKKVFTIYCFSLECDRPNRMFVAPAVDDGCCFCHHF